MLGAIFAAAMGDVGLVSFDGNFNATASGGTATSSVRNASVPAGNSGIVSITFTSVGTITASQYNINGSGFTPFSSGDAITLHDGDTLQIKTTGDNAGESRTYTLKNYGLQCANGSGIHTGA